jgi:hypothetical protein
VSSMKGFQSLSRASVISQNRRAGGGAGQTTNDNLHLIIRKPYKAVLMNGKGVVETPESSCMTGTNTNAAVGWIAVPPKRPGHPARANRTAECTAWLTCFESGTQCKTWNGIVAQIGFLIVDACWP